jgi:hypothetical protein
MPLATAPTCTCTTIAECAAARQERDTIHCRPRAHQGLRTERGWWWFSRVSTAAPSTLQASRDPCGTSRNQRQQIRPACPSPASTRQVCWTGSNHRQSGRMSMRPSACLTPAEGTLKAYPMAEFFPVRGIKRTQLATDRHRLHTPGWRFIEATEGAVCERTGSA